MPNGGARGKTVGIFTDAPHTSPQLGRWLWDVLPGLMGFAQQPTVPDLPHNTAVSSAGGMASHCLGHPSVTTIHR